MLSLLPRIPLPWRLGGIAAIATGLWFWGYTLGKHHVQEKFDTFQAEVKAAADKQTAETAAKIEAATKVTKETSDAYEKKLADLRAIAANDQRVRVDQGGCTVRTFPQSPRRPDGRPSDPQPIVAGGTQTPAAGTGGAGNDSAAAKPQVSPESQESAESALADCRAATLQLTWLQHWVREQQAINPEK